MQRQIILDTETTGLNPEEGERIIEIGCIELMDRKITKHRFHTYLNPDKSIAIEALAVHGINNAFLADKPRFADIAQSLLDYLKGAELIMHNASFDQKFLDHEIHLLAENGGLVLPQISSLCRITDSLQLAKQKHPGQRNNLDALCRRYQIDYSIRDKHGALLDAELLAQVYLRMTGGQISLALDMEPATPTSTDADKTSQIAERPPIKVVYASAEDVARHEQWLSQC